MDIQKNDIVEVTIESLGYKGEGVAKIDRVPVFITGALAGERVRAVIILVKKDFLVGKLLEVVSPSGDRKGPPCKYFGKCGGCDLQHMSYEKQLEFKQNHVESTLRKIAGITAEVQMTVPSGKQYGYRNKMSLPVRNVGGQTKMGFFAGGSHRLVEIDECILQSEKANSILPIFKQWVGGVSAYDEETGKGAVRHLSVRETDGYFSITMVSTMRVDLSGLDKMLAQNLDDYALYNNINTKHNNVIFGDKTYLVGGKERPVSVMGYKVSTNPLSFMQVNQEVAGNIYKSVAECVSGGRVLDAYCGSGTLSAMLATRAQSVVGVEIVPEAITLANQLKQDNNIQNLSFIRGDCALILPDLAKTTPFDTIILDPPRSGCDNATLTAVNTSHAQSLIYISCNPATLARDLSLLTNYNITQLTPYDMFPQTKHVECVICLTRK